MKHLPQWGGCALLALTASHAQAQVVLNEIYASHVGWDDLEFLELKGPPGDSLDNLMILVVDGDSQFCGILDRAFDLSGLTVPMSGYFVAGDWNVVPQDFYLALDNAFENGSETFYLVDAGTPAGVAAVQARIGTNVAWPPTCASGSGVTVLSTSTTILDVVAMSDGGASEAFYDGAVVLGPDGLFFPAGIFRDEDYPNAWCNTNWLDFDPVANANRPRTPGTMNTSCTDAPVVSSFCDGSDNALASCPCSNAGNADTGCDSPIPTMQGGGLTGGIKMTVVARITGVENRVTATGTGYPASSVPASVILRASTQEVFPIVFGDGLRCVGVANLTRLAATVGTSGLSTHTFGHGAMAGTGSFYYQIWFRSTPASYCDPAAAFSLSNGQVLAW